MIALIDSLKKKIFFFCACILFIALLLSFAQAAGYIQNNMTIKEYEKKNGISDSKKVEEINSYLGKKKSEIQKMSLSGITGMATQGAQEDSCPSTMELIVATVLFAIAVILILLSILAWSDCGWTLLAGCIVGLVMDIVAIGLIVIATHQLKCEDSNDSKQADDQRDGYERNEDNSDFRCQQTIRAGGTC